MTALLVDTNIFSFLFKRDSRRDLYAEDLLGKRLCLSFVSVAELRLWAIERSWGQKRRDSLEQAVLGYTILGFDSETASRWAEVAAHQRQSGRDQKDRGDWWIAACALRHSLPLVTHNARHFVGIPRLQVITHAPDPSP